MTYDCCAENERRIQAAEAAICAMITLSGSSDCERTNAMDLLAHLMNLADSKGWNFENMIQDAEAHYEAETHGGMEHGI